jgi:hypothetical protein
MCKPAEGEGKCFQLLSLWLAWRTVRVIAAVVVIVSLLALLAHGHPAGSRLGEAPVTRLRHAVQPLERQLERTTERALRR